jgi:UDP-glucose 4-epimerase
MRILVTGGAGFIGSHIVEHFQGKAAEIRVLDNLRTGFRHNLDGLQCGFIEGSITDRQTVREALQGVDYVFHMAAMVSVSESMQNIPECIDINVKGLLNVLDEACAAGVKKMVFASSAANYGDNPEVPKLESMCPEPSSPYAITKLDGEHFLELYRNEGKIRTASLRFFNVFGPRQNPGAEYAAAVPIFIQKAINGEDLTIHGDGEQTRDFIYVKDVVDALVFAAMEDDLHGVYNVGYGEQTSINQLAGHIVNMAATDSQILHGPQRPGDVRHSLASADKLRSAGWHPRFTLEQGLAATFAFFSHNPDQ